MRVREQDNFQSPQQYKKRAQACQQRLQVDGTLFKCQVVGHEHEEHVERGLVKGKGDQEYTVTWRKVPVRVIRATQ